MDNKKRVKPKSKRQGVVYILSNPAFKKGLIKIGHTKDLKKRLIALYTTGVPEKFDILYQMEFNDSYKAEKQIHSILKNYRYNKKREFFTCSLNKAKEVINHMDGKINSPNTDKSLFEVLFMISIFSSVFILALWLILNS